MDEHELRRSVWPRLRPESGELLHLDLLRFVAAAGIVLCHSGEFFAARGPGRSVFAATLGSLGLFVDTFFVISGFVISWVYADRLGKAGAYRTFLHRRAARLLPLHWLTLLLAFILYLALDRLHVPLNTRPSLSAPCVATAAALVHSFVGCGGMPLNNVSWSISAELAMYVLFPLFLVAARRGALAALALAAVLMAAVTVVRGAGAGVWEAHTDVGRAFPAFVFGMALHAAHASLARLPAPRVGMALCALVLLASPWLALPNAAFVAAAYIVPVFAVAADMRGDAPRLVHRVAPLGQLTYSLYMIHGLVIMTLVNGLGDKLLHLPQPGMAALVVAAWGVIATVAYVSLFWIEQPARRWLNGSSSRSTDYDRRTPIPSREAGLADGARGATSASRPNALTSRAR